MKKSSYLFLATILLVSLFISINYLKLSNSFSFSSAEAAKNAIGVRIARNAEHLSPADWYNKYAPSWFGNKGGGPAEMKLAGYPAVSVGSCASGNGETIYVNAANVVLDLYTNIYIISCPVDADQDTIDIFEQMINNWDFNANISDNIKKQQLQRDTKRLADLNKIKEIIEGYKENKNEKNRYPDLLSGTFEQGKSISYWNSWQNTLAKELGATLPTPPEDGSGWGPLTDLDKWQSSVPWPAEMKNPDSVGITWNPAGCRVITAMKNGIVKTWLDDYGCNGSSCTTCQQLMASTVCKDLDGDGYGSPASVYCAGSGFDCNDNSASINPSAVEVCDYVDNNCVNGIDEAPIVTYVYYRDADGDGYGDNTNTKNFCDHVAHLGYVEVPGDCEDVSDGDTVPPSSVHPMVSDGCNGVDEDCDGFVDEDATSVTYYFDNDGDGVGKVYSTPASQVPITVASCLAIPVGYVAGPAIDCNDSDNKGWTLRNYYLDADNDGFGTGTTLFPTCKELDEDAPNLSLNNDDCSDSDNTKHIKYYYYLDNDDDEHGVGAMDQMSCLTSVAGAGNNLSTVNDDCNDSNPAVFSNTTYYLDIDNDLYGEISSAQAFCTGSQTAGYKPASALIQNETDCNDDPLAGGSTVNPGISETCNGIDDNCVGGIDEGVSTTYYHDGDGDTYGAGAGLTACAPTAFYSVTNNTDCDDTPSGAGIHPGATEICNNADENCINGADDGLATSTYYKDADGDTHGKGSDSQSKCGSFGQYTATIGDDCDDDNGGIFANLPYYADTDGDGYGAGVIVPRCELTASSGYSVNNTDCVPSLAGIHPSPPSTTEICGDTLDQNCDNYNSITSTYEDTACVCGDGVRDTLAMIPEVCDGTDLSPTGVFGYIGATQPNRTLTCADFGGTGGPLSCNSGCSGYSPWTSCTGVSSSCGNTVCDSGSPYFVKDDSALTGTGVSAGATGGGFGSGTKNNTAVASGNINVGLSSQTIPKTKIEAGQNHSFAIDANGKLWAWGRNSYKNGGSSTPTYYGILGDGTTVTSRTIPVQIMTLNSYLVTDVSGGQKHSLAITSDGKLWAWGNNVSGQLGSGNTIKTSVPIQIATGFAGGSVYAGGSVSYAIKADGKIYAWGENTDGHLGMGGVFTDVTTPTLMPFFASMTVVKMAVAEESGMVAYAITNDGKLWMWGDQTNGMATNTASGIASTPIQVMSFSSYTVSDVAVGNGRAGHHSVAITSDGGLWTWGQGWGGALGSGDTSVVTTPVQIMSGVADAKIFSEGGYWDSFALVFKSDGAVWEWGLHADGGSSSLNSLIPVQKTLGFAAVAVSAGDSGILVLKDDGTVWGWGNNAGTSAVTQVLDQYNSSGDFISNPINLSVSSTFNTLSWNESIPADTRSNLLALWHFDNNYNDVIFPYNSSFDISMSLSGDKKVGTNALMPSLVSSKVDYGNILNMGANQSFTVMAWVKPPTTLPIATWAHGIISKGGHERDRGFMLGIRGINDVATSQGRAEFSVFENGSCAGGNPCGYELIAGPDLRIGSAYHHIVGVRNSATNNLSLYVDNVLVQNVIDATYADLDLTNTGYALTIGYGGPNAQALGGPMDEIAVYGKALTATEISDRFTDGLNNIQIDDIKPLRIQIATNNDNNTWNYVGPNGTASSYFTVASGTPLPVGLNNNKYLRYKVDFNTYDTSYTPLLNDITINYTQGESPSSCPYDCE